MDTQVKPFLTVFTPTYNRAELLHRGYEALLRQSSKNFVWMIIDDGSTDETESVVREWMEKDNGFEIRYYYKENGGLHTAYNTAIAHLDTVLAVCVDSDDYLLDDAVEKIAYFWQRNGSPDVAGIEALDCFADGSIVGDPMPEQKTINLIDLMVGKYKGKNGDKKPIVRSDLYKSVAPQPSFPGEKCFNPHYMHLQISFQYDFLVLNEPVCVVEYQPDGMSVNILQQYRNSPRSFAELRRLQMRFPHAPIRFRIKTAIHYDAECLLSKNRHFVRESPRKLMTVLAIPAGVLLTAVIWRKTK